MTPTDYLTVKQTAIALHVTDRTLMRWRNDGGGPAFVRCGSRKVLYRRADIDAWLAARTFRHRAHEVCAGSAAPG